MKRYAFKQDSNANKIDLELEKIPGLKIYYLGNGTIDRLIGYRGHNYLFEYKKPEGLSKRTGKPKKNDFTPKQVKFLQEWTGQVNIIRDLNDALLVLGILSGEQIQTGKPR